jgi:ATP-dependent RNA helicase DeaD
MQKQLFPDLGIEPDLLKAVESLGFEQPSPIQAAAIPPALEGRDVVGQSQTGSGKTMAFGIPAMQRINPELPAVQALVLCPTRELAMQVCSEIHKLALHKPGIRATPVYGGSSYDRQIRALKSGTQFVVGTPGRLIDLLKRRALQLNALQTLVFDEADEMLKMGFRDDIEKLLEFAPEDRQTIFFSATMSRPIRELVKKFTKDPAVITIEHKNLTVPTVEQSYYEVRGRSKVEALSRVMDMEGGPKTIVFANTKRAVDDIVDALVGRGYPADRLHGDLTQPLRDRVMRNFRNSTVEILVATDVAGRGLDVEDVDLIVNYDLPYDEEDYVHRIGRTGRAGRSGKAASLIAGRDIFLLQRIMRYTRARIQRCKVPSQEEVENTRVDKFFEKVKATLETGEYSPHEGPFQRLLDAGHTSTDISSALIHMLLEDTAREGEEIAEDSMKPRPERRERYDRGDRNDRGDRPGGGGNRDRRPERESSFTPNRPTAPEGFTRLFINVGSMDSVEPRGIATVLMEAAGLQPKAIRKIDIFEKSSYVEVSTDAVKQVFSGIKGVQLQGRSLRMDYADRPMNSGPGNFGGGGYGKKPFGKKPYGKPFNKRGDFGGPPRHGGKPSPFRKKRYDD